jgi:hypothetical protein
MVADIIQKRQAEEAEEAEEAEGGFSIQNPKSMAPQFPRPLPHSSPLP